MAITSTLSKSCISSSSQNELIPGLPNDIAIDCLLRVPITSHPTLRLVSLQWKSIVSQPSFFTLRQRNRALTEHLVFLIQPLSPPLPPSLTSSKSKQEEIREQPKPEPRTSLLYNLSVYNSTLNEWRNLSNISIPTFAQCVALPKVGKVIVLGGWDPATLDPVSRVVVVDIVRGVWREGSPMSTARSFFACAAAGPATVYVAGGHDGRKNALRTAEVYDVEADEWRSLPDMAEERDESHGVLSGGDDSKFWVVSGYGTESQGRFRSDAEIFDPETNTWESVAGVWPHPGQTPKSTTAEVRRWRRMIGGELREFDFEEKSWKVLNTGTVPKSVIGSTSISMVEMGEEGMMVMGNGERSGECEEEGCGGEGVFILEKTEKNWRWKHVHAPPAYLGFPFSASHLFI